MHSTIGAYRVEQSSTLLLKTSFSAGKQCKPVALSGTEARNWAWWHSQGLILQSPSKVSEHAWWWQTSLTNGPWGQAGHRVNWSQAQIWFIWTGSDMCQWFGCQVHSEEKVWGGPGNQSMSPGLHQWGTWPGVSLATVQLDCWSGWGQAWESQFKNRSYREVGSTWLRPPNRAVCGWEEPTSALLQYCPWALAAGAPGKG